MASGDTLLILRARDFDGTATTGALPGVITGASSPAESIEILKFDAATDWFADGYNLVMPKHYAGTTGITCVVIWSAASATSGTCRWGLALRKVGDDAEDQDTTAHTYDFNFVGATAPSAAGETSEDNITFTDGADMDSVAAGNMFHLRVTRDADGSGGTDDMTGNSQLQAIHIYET